ncbi:hypothetical protein [Anaerosporobacter sp.]|uniref:hypothetical protein n=1 Tax=Anaerosporobacter sp. TaxID=1872529 RepID=UPI00286F2D27|nr:hypothetical protein [Anaerosporobacter sp.]
MNEKRFITQRNNHNTYGGKLYSTDFNTCNCNGNMVSRIISDLRFDEQCKTNAENRCFR